ncbi:MAG: hypothetical protein ABIO05_02410 [Ferruginibacter sp.]
MKKQDLDSLIDATLNSMDEHKALAPKPFLYTRIVSRLNSPTAITIWEKLYATISRPAIAMALLFIVVILNGLIIFYSDKREASNFSAETTLTELQNLTVSNNTAYYDIENIAP